MKQQSILVFVSHFHAFCKDIYIKRNEIFSSIQKFRREFHRNLLEIENYSLTFLTEVNSVEYFLRFV